MDICQTILDVITHALKLEECRLKPRSKQELWPWTVRGYPNEYWIGYLLVSQLSDVKQFPGLKMQPEAKSGKVRRLDLLIVNHAAVELKGPYEVREKFPKGLYRKILKDFEKQHRRANQEHNPDLEHLVLLLLHAGKSEFDSGSVKRWLDQLETDVRKEVPGICIGLDRSEQIVLNGKDDRRMQCCLYNVRKKSSDARFPSTMN